MKTKCGRKKASGVLSGINPQCETWSEIRNRIIYDSAEWPLVGLRMVIGDGSQLADNHLSALLSQYDAECTAHVLERQAIFRNYRTAKTRLRALRAMRHKQPVIGGEDGRWPKVLTFWRRLAADFERAVLNGDAGWFGRQWKALGHVQSQEKIRFNAKVVYLFEQAMWGTHARQGVKCTMPDGGVIMEGIEDLTLTPAGKFTDAMASHIWNALEKHRKDGQLYVEGCKFENKERVMEAIHDLATQLQFELKKQQRRKRKRR